MPEDIAILSQMIRDTAKVSLKDNYSKKTVELTEPACPTTQVTIYGLPDDIVVIKADKFRSPDTIFAGSNGECKRCDFLVVAVTSKKKVILYIEMKAEKAPREEIVRQLKGARCFVVYCREIAKEFWDYQALLEDYEERYISIGHISIGKKPTRITRDKGKHDRPERFMKIGWPHHLEFGHLAS
jgi:hypothetical protein